MLKDQKFKVILGYVVSSRKHYVQSKHWHGNTFLKHLLLQLMRRTGCMEAVGPTRLSQLLAVPKLP